MATQQTEVNSLSTLTALVESGKRPRYLFFWGHTPNKNGSLGSECFSQWYPARFAIDGIGYSSAEHYMMAQKAALFEDPARHSKILAAKSPGAAKALGRAVRGFSQERWDSERFRIVVRASAAIVNY